MVTVAEVTAEMFYREGVRAVFSLMGTANMAFVSAVPSVMRLVSARHEGMAVAMADGYARASGEVGVATVTRGPGLTNTATSLQVARRSRTPLVLLVGDSSASEKHDGGLQDLAHESFVNAAGVLFHQMRSPRTVAADVRHAFYLAWTEKLPVVLNAPQDTLAGHIRGDPLATYVTAKECVSRQEVLPIPDVVSQALGMVVASRRPIVLAGRGALEGKGIELAEELAEATGALLATTLGAKGAFDLSSHNLGLAGGFALSRARSLFARADLVIAVGTSLSDYTTDSGRLFPHAKTLAINIDANVFGEHWQRGSTVTLRATAEVGLRALIDGFPQQRPSVGFRTRRTMAQSGRDQRVEDIDETPAIPDPGTVDPRRLMLALDPVLPRDCLIVIGCGHFWSFPNIYLSGYRRREFINVIEFGTTGQGMGAAMGAAVARPDRLVVAFEGDASAMMNIQELETAARNDLRLLLFVLNDRRLGSETIQLQRRGLDSSLADISPPDFAQLARALGVSGRRIQSLRLGNAVRNAISEGRTHVFDVQVNRNVVNPTYIG